MCVCVPYIHYSNSDLPVRLFSIFKASSKEIKLFLFYSSFILALCNWPPKSSNTGILQCDLVIFIIFWILWYFP